MQLCRSGINPKPGGQQLQRLLVLGGCRSGKSRFAEEWARQRSEHRLFIATLVPGDDVEMIERVKMHRRDRGEGWQAIEEPEAVVDILSATSRSASVFLVDCLTLWITNLILRNRSDQEILNEVQRLTDLLAAWSAPIALVANEVGLGIVPDNELARRFRDLAGWTNQQVAAVCDQVVFMAAGLPICLKGDEKL